MNVSWNLDSYDKYLKPIFQKVPSYEETILEDFITYKINGFPTKFFGRDTIYIKPESIIKSQLYHIHLNTENKFKSGALQWSKTSNSALVYVQHKTITERYSLLAIFPKDAHKIAQDTKIMTMLANYANIFHEIK